MKNITLKFLFFFFVLHNLSFGQITANPDIISYSTLSGVNFNLLANDFVDLATGSPITNPSDVIVTLLTPTSGAVISNGRLLIGSGFSGPIYLYYQICETANPSNCSVSFIHVIPTYFVVANLDFISVYSDTTTTIPSVRLNDTVDGNYDPNMAILWTSTSAYPEITLNPDGTVDVLPGLAPGNYSFPYIAGMGGTYQSSGSLKIEVLPSITLTANGTYNDFNADGYTSVGDVINYQYTINNIRSFPLNGVNVTSPTVSMSGSPISVLAPGATDLTTFTGQYLLTQNDINTGGYIAKTATTSATSSYGIQSVNAFANNTLGISNGIKLNAFFDTNGNGVQNVGEVNLNVGQFHYEINGDGIIHNVTSSSGTHYLYESNPTTTYNLSYTLDPAFSTHYVLSTSAYPSITVASGSGITTYNFPIVAGTLFNDLSVYVLPNLENPRPGFAYNNTIKFTNHSNQTISSGTVSFNCDSTVSILSVSPAATSLTATNFTYDFINLLPFETRYINITMQVPVIPTVSLGQLVTNTATIIPNLDDTTLLNNTSNLTQTIVGAYDPNDKMESHGKEILHSSFTSNDYLTYTIRFENTGTANAVNVRVNDVLNSQLDETSIKIIDASHNYYLDRVGTNLNFKFDAIDLPPSITDSTIGKGYIVFQVKPKPGYAIGDIISNTANIYFDFNPAIVTNTFLTKFVSVLNSDSFENNQTNIFPNPTSNILNIESKSTITNVEIMDINGRSLLSKKENTYAAVINIESFSSGIYFVKVSNEKGSFVQKIIKK